MTVMRSLVITVALLIAFVAGAAAQRQAIGGTIQGTVMDNNTVPEEIEYWEVKSATGESVVVMGRRDVPIIRWLRQAKGKTVLLSAAPPEAVAARLDSSVTEVMAASSDAERCKAR
jgi:hypothetical protein